jgi:hypothetical protein
MYAIELKSYSHHGLINIPAGHQEWFGKPVKVILLTTVPPTPAEPVSVPKPRRLPKGAGQYHSGRSDISVHAEEFWFQPDPGVQSDALPGQEFQAKL